MTKSVSLQFLLLALFVFLRSDSGTAAPPDSDQTKQEEKQEQQAEDSSPPHSVILKEEDWKQAPLKPMSSAELDRLITKELRLRNVEPAALTTDERFLRRVSLDLTGQIPSPDSVIEFVASTDPEKRRKVIDELLESDAYARHWARFWRDVVTTRLTLRRTMGLTRSFEEWLFEQFRAEKSWREITRSILTAEGELRFTLNVPSPKNGALFFLVAHDGDEAEERAAETSRVFLGIQIQCAQCHDHPTEKWTREQFHELAAYFSRIKYKQLFDKKKLSGVQLVTLPDVEHKMPSLIDPEDKTTVHPRFLNGQSPGTKLNDRERRQSLADLIVDDQNHWFAAAYVNRVWNELMGQPFFEHVDDLGPMKSVIFPEVLIQLTAGFRGTDYDIKAMFRTIMNSEAYQRQIQQGGAAEVRSPFAAATPTRLRPDTLWDGLVHVLGKIEHGARFHTGSGVRFSSSFLEGRFRATFDFDPSLDQEDVKGTLPQTLLMMNNIKLNKRIEATRTTLLGRLLKEYPEDPAAIKQLYLTVLARTPTNRELSRCSSYLSGIPDRAEAYEDILWALINSTEFQTKR